MTGSLVAAVIIAVSASQAGSGLPPGTVIDTVARGLAVPWGVAFSPDGRIYISERPGRIRVIDQSRLRPEPWLTLPVATPVGAGLLGLANWRVTEQEEIRLFETPTRIRGAFMGLDGHLYVTTSDRRTADAPDDLLLRIRPPVR